MSKQSRAGRYYEPVPIDAEILSRLPEKGISGGVHWKGIPVRHLVRDVREAHPETEIKESLVSARLRSMKVAGYVEDFAATGGKIWAKTPDGVAHERTLERMLRG